MEIIVFVNREKWPVYNWSIGTQTVNRTIEEPITLGEDGYTIELPQIIQYFLQEGYALDAQSEVVFTIAEDYQSIQILQGTIGPKMVLRCHGEEYDYNEVLLTIEATITDQEATVEEVTFPDAAFHQEVLKQADINGDEKNFCNRDRKFRRFSD